LPIHSLSQRRSQRPGAKRKRNSSKAGGQPKWRALTRRKHAAQAIIIF
jgi:hypothetical protein